MRNVRAGAAAMVLGSVLVDLERRWVERDGAREHLTTLEAEVLRYLVEAGRPVSREELLGKVWGYAEAVSSRACDTAIHRLRNKIEDDPTQPTVIITVHGTGYRLVHEVTPSPAPHNAVTSSTRRYSLADRTLDLDRLCVEGPDGTVALTGREAQVLEVLLAAPGASLERETLQRRVWGKSQGRPLDNTIARLRRKLEPDPGHPRYLLTTAHGYRLELPEPGAPAAPREDLLRPLPAEVDRRFGREAEIVACQRAFAAGDRLLTLVGPGGVGKTRLALAVAEHMAAQGAQVAWVEAAEARTLPALCALVAHALRVRLLPEDPLAGLVAALQGEQLLLALDNLEQIPEAGACAGGLLAGLPSLRVLATSRLPLRARGERVVTVEPLPAQDAAELFLERAAHAPSPEQRPLVLQLVHELDGLPLAIELAAARTRLLSVSQIHERVHQAMALLSSGTGRYQSLRASFDGSWQLAPPHARAALAQLTVFEGGFTVEAALAVLDLGAWPEARWPLDTLQELVDASLVRYDAAERRFSLLFVLREYAREHLDASERLQAERRHGQVYRDPLGIQGKSWHEVLKGPGRQESFRQLQLELGNVTAALERALQRKDPEVAVDCLAAAWRVWSSHGSLEPARRALRELQELPLSEGQRAQVEVLAGLLSWLLGDLAATERHLHAGRALAQSQGDAALEADALLSLSRMYLDALRPEGRLAAEQGLVLARREGLWAAECSALLQVAWFQWSLTPALALQTLLDAEQVAQAHSASDYLAQVWMRRGMIAQARGRHEQAAAHFERALSFQGEPHQQALSRYYHALLLYLLGQHAQALERAQSAEAALRRSGHRLRQGHALQLVGLLQAKLGDPDQAELSLLQAIGLMRACGDRPTEFIVLNELAGVKINRRDAGRQELREATDYCEQALRIAEELGEPRREASVRVNLARLAWLAGEPERAVAGLKAAMAQCEAAQYLPGKLLALGELATLLADTDRLDEAHEHASSLLLEEERHESADARADALLVLIAVEARRGDLERAERRLEELHQLTGGAPPRELAAYSMALAELAHARGDPDALRQALAQAAHHQSPHLLGQRYRDLCGAL